MLAKIVDHPTLFRDMDNQHIVQTDTSVVRKHEVRMKAIEEKKALKAEIDSIKSDVQEIKRLLQAMVPTPQYAQPYVGVAPGYIGGPYIGAAVPLTVGGPGSGVAPLTVGQSFTGNATVWIGGTSGDFNLGFGS